ncbi:TRI14 protein, partial [Neodrepanis coruscans]|nr:TRI14 protein [Neodrepanis coruscans]
CEVHAGRPLELFCEDCGRCVCAVCPVLGAHRGHRACLLPQAVRQMQELMALCLKDLDERKHQEAGNRRNIEQAVNNVKAHANMIKRHISEKVIELQLLLREEESLAKNFIDEKTQQALRAHDQQLKSCQEQLAALETFSCQIRQIQQNTDAIQSLEKYREIDKEVKESRHLLEEWHPIPLSFEHILDHYKHFIRVLQSILQKPLEDRLKEGTLESALNFAFFCSLCKYSVEYDSVHPRLKLSDDRLIVSCSWRRMFYPCGPQRFDKLWQVLSKDAFFSGSHYWEVDLLQAGAGWWIGGAYPSIGRKEDSETCRLGWNRASWCLKKFEFEYWAFHKGERIPILIEDDPHCVGIFLDYEAGILSFCNVSDGMAHLHTFRWKFTEPVYPALRLWENSIRICKLT